MASTNDSDNSPEFTEIDRIITASVQRVKRSEDNNLSVDDLLILERIGAGAATHAGAKKVVKVSAVRTSASSASLVMVQPGDTLYAIGLKHGLTISEISSLNGMSDPYVVRVGQKLRVN
ncbi:MAG: LysM peptidoglycan-binding domain-containing protein [Rhizobiaceae bacterium]|nr:LysM peptidoglycan-binding domain-containing protein [Rhizobiaceae bacterium]